ncbi:MAG: GNAT family N-acetyltransferase [Clostridia bacterium]|nr:GNAT family N-acetyltransferase [Clostridia bacterium]
MEIRHAKKADLPQILAIYEAAVIFMREQNNPNQWTKTPEVSLLTGFIEQEKLYVCEDKGEIVGVFYFAIEEDETYKVIDGEWPNDREYGVIHKISALHKSKGVGTFMISWCLKQIDNVRIDTHEDNVPMQNLLAKLGFSYCGVIRLQNGEPRRAYQKDLRQRNT